MITAKLKEANVYCTERGFVTLDQAKKLKKMGYHYPTHACFMVPRKGIYIEKGIKMELCENAYIRDYNDNNDAEFSFEYIAAPTLSQVHEMLREKHIYISVFPLFDKDGLFFDFRIVDIFLDPDNPRSTHYDYKHPVYKTYNHALSDAIEEAFLMYHQKI